MLYLYGETPLVNYGPWSILLHLYYHLLQALFTFRKYYFTSLQTYISFHIVLLILCFHQTSESENLTISWGKVFWLCCVQVPHCYWRRHRAINCLLEPASNNLQKWFLSPTSRLNFGFILRENLLLCSSYLPLGVSQRVLWDIKTVFWRRCRGERGFLQGESLTSNLFTLLLFCLVSLLYFVCFLVSKIKKLVPFIVVIFVCLF
jgi:hypothetical protein